MKALAKIAEERVDIERFPADVRNIGAFPYRCLTSEPCGYLTSAHPQLLTSNSNHRQAICCPVLIEDSCYHITLKTRLYPGSSIALSVLRV